MHIVFRRFCWNINVVFLRIFIFVFTFSFSCFYWSCNYWFRSSLSFCDASFEFRLHRCYLVNRHRYVHFFDFDYLSMKRFHSTFLIDQINLNTFFARWTSLSIFSFIRSFWSCFVFFDLTLYCNELFDWQVCCLFRERLNDRCEIVSIDNVKDIEFELFIWRWQRIEEMFHAFE